MRKSKYFKWLIFTSLIFFLLVIVSLISISFGPGGIIFLNSLNDTERVLLFKLRMPRLIMALSVGGALSLAGVILQSLFRNPLVEPYTIGISGGAVLGVALTMFLNLNKLFGVFTIPLASFLGSVSVIMLLLLVLLNKKTLKIESFLLKGVMISFICSSIFMLIMALSKTSNLQKIVYWMMGHLDQSENSLILFSFISSIIGLILSCFFAIELNLFLLGEEEAVFLGLKVESLKKFFLLLSAFLTAVTVSVAGIVGFVGLVVPHFVKLLFGYDHRIVLINSYLCGAIFLILCDIIARTIVMPIELPVGVITGILGGTLFIYALTKKERI